VVRPEEAVAPVVLAQVGAQAGQAARAARAVLDRAAERVAPAEAVERAVLALQVLPAPAVGRAVPAGPEV